MQFAPPLLLGPHGTLLLPGHPLSISALNVRGGRFPIKNLHVQFEQ